MKNSRINGYENLQINSYIYDEVKDPKATIIIIHGMQEHAGRYDEFAKFLSDNNYIVIATDLRGHGKTAKDKDSLGLSEGDIYREILADQQCIINYAKETYHLPIYVFGHSYGSLVSQTLIQENNDIEKCVLCGTANGGSALMKAGNAISAILGLFTDRNKRGGLLENMCVGGYGKGYENGNWLSRDEQDMINYQKDEYCGVSFPFSFYRSMINNLVKANKGIDKIGKKKLFLIAGTDDPVGAKGKDVEALYNIYKEKGINAKLKLYKDARHELLNEINKDEVFKDVLDFFNE